MGADWINGAADTDNWWGVVKAVMNIWAPWNVGNFLTRWGTVTFFRKNSGCDSLNTCSGFSHLEGPPPLTQSKQTSHTLPTRAQWLCNAATGLASFGTALHYITVCVSTCLPVRVQCCANYANPSKIITSWGAPSHNWQCNVVLHRCSRYTGFVKCLTFLLQFLALELLISRQKLVRGTTGQSSRTSLWKLLVELEAKVKDLG